MPDRRLGTILDRFVAGDLPANVALMQLLVEARSPDEAAAFIESRLADGAAPARLELLRALLRAHPAAWTVIRSVMREAEHDGGASGPRHWAGVFDRLARQAPEASVALYALGSPELLRAATGEIVERMRGWGLLGPTRRLLEIGCGIGRLALALAPEMGGTIGLDVSEGMIGEARRRGEAVPNLSFRQTGGLDLAGIPDGSQDVVLAADVFPYLVGTDAALVRTHVEEAARVLAPGGALVIFNYSYRGDDALDLADVRSGFGEAGLLLERSGLRDLSLWDAACYLGRKPG